MTLRWILMEQDATVSMISCGSEKAHMGHVNLVMDFQVPGVWRIF